MTAPMIRADAPELLALVATMRKMHEGWSNALELGLIPERHRVSAQILREWADSPRHSRGPCGWQWQ